MPGLATCPGSHLTALRLPLMGLPLLPLSVLSPWPPACPPQQVLDSEVHQALAGDPAAGNHTDLVLGPCQFPATCFALPKISPVW